MPSTESTPRKNDTARLLGTMPSFFVLVRHGESQANIIQRAVKEGKLPKFPDSLAKTPDREIRLSKDGVKQAIATGGWLKAQYPSGFDILYVSDHTRAKETALHVCKTARWKDVEIRVDPLLGERNWGRFPFVDRERREEIMRDRKRDPLHVAMPDGETLLAARHRSRELLDRVARQDGGKKVLVFSHGEFIEAIWAEIGHMNTERHTTFFQSKEGDIKNCQIVEFSSVNPADSEYLGKLRWVRSSCPQAGIYGEWAAIERKGHSLDDLEKEVSRYPHLDLSDARLK